MLIIEGLVALGIMIVIAGIAGAIVGFIQRNKNKKRKHKKYI